MQNVIRTRKKLHFSSKLKREYYLFSKSGFTSDLIDSNIDNVHLYTLDDLFNI